MCYKNLRELKADLRRAQNEYLSKAWRASYKKHFEYLINQSIDKKDLKDLKDLSSYVVALYHVMLEQGYAELALRVLKPIIIKIFDIESEYTSFAEQLESESRKGLITNASKLTEILKSDPLALRLELLKLNDSKYNSNALSEKLENLISKSAFNNGYQFLLNFEKNIKNTILATAYSDSTSAFFSPNEPSWASKSDSSKSPKKAASQNQTAASPKPQRKEKPTPPNTRVSENRDHAPRNTF